MKILKSPAVMLTMLFVVLIAAIGVLGYGGYSMFVAPRQANATPTPIPQAQVVEPTTKTTTAPTSKPASANTNAEFIVVPSMQAPINKEYNGKLNYNFKVFNELQDGGVVVVPNRNDGPTPPAVDGITKIQIENLAIDAPIIHGLDGEKALRQGWWIYTASRDKGEKIFLAHRRWWKPGHPYSAWNLDKLPVGSTIKLVDANNQTYTYEVTSQSIRDGYDLSIFRPSNDDYVKIITCSTWTGDAGSSEYRYVTLAKRVS